VLEGARAIGRDLVVSEVSTNKGRMLRTGQYKYITYANDPAEQLFDMKKDPGETKNLAADSGHASVLGEHRKLLREHEGRLDVPQNVPNAEYWGRKG